MVISVFVCSTDLVGIWAISTIYPCLYSSKIMRRLPSNIILDIVSFEFTISNFLLITEELMLKG